MSETQTMRASDSEQQRVVDRLRGAVGDGRLTMDEYMSRMELAYKAVTYGDLAPLYADLPQSGSTTARHVTSPSVERSAAVTRRGGLAGLPCVLKVLWAIWLTAVSINVVVWALVSGTTGHLIYPWPLWVAGPFGAGLFAVSVAVSKSRSNRRSVAKRLPSRPGKADRPTSSSSRSIQA